MKVFASLMLFAGMTGPAAGPPYEPVRDEAHVFRPETQKQAAENIRDIRRLFHRDVLIETMELSAEQAARVRKLSRADEVAFFSGLGEERARAAEIEGILILICRAPSTVPLLGRGRKLVQITVWPESERQTFTDKNAEQLRRKLTRRLPGGLDGALLDGLHFVRDTWRHNLQLEQADDGSATAGTLWMIVAGFLIVWIVLLLVSFRWGSASTDANEALQPALLGAIFGQPAATPIYDRLLPPAPAGATEATLSFFAAPRPPAPAATEPSFVTVGMSQAPPTSAPVPTESSQ